MGIWELYHEKEGNYFSFSTGGGETPHGLALAHGRCHHQELVRASAGAKLGQSLASLSPGRTGASKQEPDCT